MRISTLALVGAVAMFATAAYADDMLSSSYGNTVVTKNEKTGTVQKTMLNADGTYTATGTDPSGASTSTAGTWAMKDAATMCMTPKAGTPGPSIICTPVAKHAVGDNWTVTTEQGEMLNVSIVAGR